jgi:hypothetical protein
VIGNDLPKRATGIGQGPNDAATQTQKEENQNPKMAKWLLTVNAVESW